jgi:preprotein translocase subunit SecB
MADMEKTGSTGHVRLQDLFCRKAEFRQVKLPAGGDGSRQRIGTPEELSLGISLKAFDRDRDRVDVELTVRVEPDEEGRQPYDLSVTYLGRFEFGELPEGLKRESFVQRNAAAIMFPFVREAIGNFTSRGAYGPLLLPPINVVAMLDKNRDRAEQTESVQHN